MNFKAITYYFVFFGFYSLVHGQTVTVSIDSIRHSNPIENKTYNDFCYLHDGVNARYYTWLADVIYEFDSLKNFDRACNSIIINSINMRANGFKVIDSDITSKHKYIKTSIYKITKKGIRENDKLYFENKIYVFGLMGHIPDDFHVIQLFDFWEYYKLSRYIKNTNVKVLVKGSKYIIKPFEFIELGLTYKERLKMIYKTYYGRYKRIIISKIEKEANLYFFPGRFYTTPTISKKSYVVGEFYRRICNKI
ncbi:hypothetical protein DNU06_17435 [Putridiphycobacter roseus]|uniref:Uncharacterized protein n=1 Tax=Putridiphycobacter roseus TaxID=2219161 RepID=A0A2W1MW09_9FLAO|nr:hypothetical protein [Putridiphycobacter roseus]PZE15564.1 hypothetical protein DNU06_17435 [Putridiphycobacter roseus]